MKKVSLIMLLLVAGSFPALAEEISLEELQERVKRLEAWQEEPSEKIKSKKGSVLKFGGDIEYEYVDEQNEPRSSVFGSATSTPQSRFQLDRVALKLFSNFGGDLEFFSDLHFKGEDKIRVREGFVTLKNLPFRSQMRLGIFNRFIRPERKTETYPLAGSSFWNDPETGLEIGGDYYKMVYWRASLTNGNPLSVDKMGEDSAKINSIFKDDGYLLNRKEINDNKMIGGGLGFKPDLGILGRMDILGFLYDAHSGSASISSTDLGQRALSTNLPGYNSTDDTMRRYGLALAWELKRLDFYGQWIHADDGLLDRHSWYVQESFDMDIGWKYLKSVTPLVRYNEYIVERIAPVINKPLTWDRYTYTLALLNEIRKGLVLKLEYNINRESTGGSVQEADNNEFLAQLKYSF